MRIVYFLCKHFNGHIDCLEFLTQYYYPDIMTVHVSIAESAVAVTRYHNNCPSPKGRYRSLECVMGIRKAEHFSLRHNTFNLRDRSFYNILKLLYDNNFRGTFLNDF